MDDRSSHVIVNRPDPVPVCERCRKRKQRCDNELRACTSCAAAGIECMIPDPDNQRHIPRSYVLQLEQHRAHLREKLESRRLAVPRRIMETQHEDVSMSVSVAAAPSNVHSTGRYLGASSGMAFVESAILMAQNQGLLEAPHGTSKVECNSAGPTPTAPADEFLSAKVPPTVLTPPRDRVESMFAHFSNVQWQYRVIELREFKVHLDRFYGPNPSESPASCIVVYMVLAVSLHFSGRNDGNAMLSNLADDFHDQAQTHLTSVLACNSLETLQALLLLLVYSIVNPQKPSVWHLLGRAWRIAVALQVYLEEACVELETLHDVESSTLPRRLFWSLYSMDRTVGNTLGRPTTLLDSSITTMLPLVSPEEEGRPSGVAAAVHCFRLRQIQSEAADIMYQRLRELPPNFIYDTQVRLDEWRSAIPSQLFGDSIEDWLQHAYYNACMFIHRPSPANPRPSTQDLEFCFEAASQVMHLYSRLHGRGSIDSTWIAVHWLFLAAVTHLFCLWASPQLRQSADWNRVNEDVQDTGMILAAMTERWQSSRKVLSIYRRLARGTLQKYAAVTLKSASNNIESPSTQPSFAQLGGFGDTTGDLDMQFWFDEDLMSYSLA
jgi:hypothetical protein